MKTDQKITIKVISKTEQRIMSNPEVEMITEWNIKRIFYALLLLLFLVVIPSYYLSSLDEGARVETKMTINKPTLLKKMPIKENLTQAERDPFIAEPVNAVSQMAQQAVPIQDVVTEKELISPEVINMPDVLNANISRAQLAQGVSDKEPYGQVKLPLIVTGEKAAGVFYFTEVMNMKGSKVLHEWLHQGKLIYKRTFIIRGDRWRISTSKLFGVNYTGSWQVRAVTKQGEVLHSLKFSVEAE